MDYLVVERPWGRFERLTHNKNSTVKLLYIKKGETLSLQYHNNRDEYWKIIEGNPFIEIGELREQANVGDMFEIKKESRHRISAPENNVIILEISLGNFDEEDIVRVEDKYNRV
jgi:mannose-1-phosphate guanylyltransferase/mannose-1-phosphate guanylyltransferase/mannose-6-phosphate isomerase